MGGVKGVRSDSPGTGEITRGTAKKPGQEIDRQPNKVYTAAGPSLRTKEMGKNRIAIAERYRRHLVSGAGVEVLALMVVWARACEGEARFDDNGCQTEKEPVPKGGRGQPRGGCSCSSKVAMFQCLECKQAGADGEAKTARRNEKGQVRSGNGQLYGLRRFRLRKHSPGASRHSPTTHLASRRCGRTARLPLVSRAGMGWARRPNRAGPVEARQWKPPIFDGTMPVTLVTHARHAIPKHNCTALSRSP